MLRCEPPTRTLAPTPAPRATSPLAPTYSPAKAPAETPDVGAKTAHARPPALAVLERVQQRLDQDPNKMTLRRQTAEHPFGTIKAWMGATHFLMRRRHKVATEMALNVLAYNMKRAIAILGCVTLLEAMQT